MYIRKNNTILTLIISLLINDLYLCIILLSRIPLEIKKNVALNTNANKTIYLLYYWKDVIISVCISVGIIEYEYMHSKLKYKISHSILRDKVCGFACLFTVFSKLLNPIFPENDEKEYLPDNT